MLELREAIANYYRHQFDYNIEHEDIYISPGSKESIFQVLFLLDGPLLLPAPCWVNYAPQATVLDKPYTIIETSFESGYKLKPELLQKSCLKYPVKQQKILLLNSPNNPTGLCYKQEEFNALSKVCQQQNIIIISDEIYAGIQFDDDTHASMFRALPDRTIITSGISKLFSAGGYRLGYSIIPKALVSLKQPLESLISETYSCVSSPIQYAALSAFEDYDLIYPYLLRCNEVHKMVADYFDEAFKTMGARVHKQQGAFYLMPDFSAYSEQLKNMGINNDIELCQHLLKEYKVAFLPGSEFGVPAMQYSMRVATVDYDGEQALNA